MGSRDAALSFFIDRQPAGRFGKPSEIAGLCAFLASDDASYINGHNLVVDGGITAHTGQPNVFNARMLRAQGHAG